MTQTLYAHMNKRKKIPITKIKGWWSSSRCRPEFKPNAKKKKVKEAKCSRNIMYS
jgi:hypothetical protein